jgi:SAM-dependent methyltransferase
MARGDFYASAFGVAYSSYMERPWLGRLIGRIVWGGDSRRYYESMDAIAEAAPGATVVDCPCGAGPAFRRLDPGRPGRYLAADLSPSMLRRARGRAVARGLDEVEIAVASATEIPLEDGGAELFLSYWGLHCFDEPELAVAEAARVLAPGGRLVGCCFVRGRESRRQRLLVVPHRGDFGPLGSEAEVRGWLTAAGFELGTAERSGPMFFFDARLARD